MPGRHRSQQAASDGRRGSRLAIAAAALAVVAVAAWALLAAQDASDVAGASASPDAGTQLPCETTVVVPVAAAASIAEVVEGVAATAQAEGSLGPCVEVSVTAEESQAMADSTLTSDSASVWVADASMWADYMTERLGEGAVQNRGSMASSPLVVAATASAAEQLGDVAAEAAPSVLWAQALGSPVGLGIVDPETSTEGLATLATLGGLLGAEPGDAPPQDLVRSYVGMSRGVIPTVDEAIALLGSSDAAPLVATTEQSVLAHAAESDGAVVALYPSPATSVFDYPVLRLNRPGEAEGVDEAAAALIEQLTSPPAQQAAQQAGFRGPDGSPPSITTTLDVPGDAPPSIDALTLPVAQDALRTWSAVTLEARMLTVIDVSGSMDQDAGQGRTRIELARDASLAALRLYPDSAEIGLWAFSVLLDPPSDWVSLVDVGALDDDLEGLSRREVLLRQADTLPGLVGGGTGLYDTTLGAFRTVRDGYDPARINSVVLLTDGRNEDDPVGIDVETLLRTLRAEFDPAQPVPVITIGMGPDADMDTLRRISETTGGKAYTALDPNDIEPVFLDAMIERRCRPDC